MDDLTVKGETWDVAVTVVGNEAESAPAQEGKSAATGRSDLDACPICHLNFHSREPRLLPCLHSFCGECLPSPSRRLAVTEPPNSRGDGATKPLNVIRCPVCRQECMEADVMENIFVKDSVEAPSSTVEGMVQLCMTCDDGAEAAGFCVDCVEYLCATCVEAHQRVRFTRDHTIMQKAEVSREARGASARRLTFCDVHKRESLRLFCETCDLLTCRDCQLVKHKDHSYQLLEDAYRNHKQHMENMTHRLQEKKKLIEEVADAINDGLLRVDQNRASVRNDIKKSVCSLILEIHKKGEMLIDQVEAATKEHEAVLHKQREDIGYLSRHLDHVIHFTEWAAARNGGTALLYCKRLILFQIGNLLRVKCNTSFIPRSTVHFQCRSSYWASNVDLGSLVVESVPGYQLAGFQGIPRQLPHPGQGPSGSAQGFAPPPRNTLTQLQMQVDKLNPQARWQPQPPPPPWTWYQSTRLQQTIPGSLRGGAASDSVPPQPQLPDCVSPMSSPPSPGFTSQPLWGMGSCPSYQPEPVDVFSSSPLYNRMTTMSSPPPSQRASAPSNPRDDSGGPVRMLEPSPPSLPPSLPRRDVQGAQNSPGYAAASQEEEAGTVSWKPAGTRQTGGAAARKRRRLSPGPIIVIKDEPDDGSSYVHADQRASLPDSTGDRPRAGSQGEGSEAPTSLRSTDDKPRGDQGETDAPDQLDGPWAPLGDPNEALCAVCQDGGELLRCRNCPRVFHLSCHVPTLLRSPSGEWFCSFCRDLLAPELECESKPDARTAKKEPDSEGGFTPADKQVCTLKLKGRQEMGGRESSEDCGLSMGRQLNLKCERLLLHLFCCDPSSDFQESAPPSVCANNRPAPTGPMKLSAVKKRLEATHSLCYHSPAEFVSDVRLVFGGCALLSQADSGGKLRELFEEHLGIFFPDRTFPEVQPETTRVAPPLTRSAHDS